MLNGSAGRDNVQKVALLVEFHFAVVHADFGIEQADVLKIGVV